MNNNVDEIMKAMDNASRAMPDEAFLSKIENVALQYVKIPTSFSWSSIAGIAASFLILLMTNFFVLSSNDSTIKNEKVETSITGYNLIPTKSIYNEQG